MLEKNTRASKVQVNDFGQIKNKKCFFPFPFSFNKFRLLLANDRKNALIIIGSAMTQMLYL